MLRSPADRCQSSYQARSSSTRIIKFYLHLCHICPARVCESVGYISWIRSLWKIGISTLGVFLCFIWITLFSLLLVGIFSNWFSILLCSGVMSAMSAMVNLEIPWINIMSKMDLITGDARNGNKGKKEVARWVVFVSSRAVSTSHLVSANLDLVRFLDPDPLLLATASGHTSGVEKTNPKFHALNQALVQLVRPAFCFYFSS